MALPSFVLSVVQQRVRSKREVIGQLCEVQNNQFGSRTPPNTAFWQSTSLCFHVFRVKALKLGAQLGDVFQVLWCFVAFQPRCHKY